MKETEFTLKRVVFDDIIFTIILGLLILFASGDSMKVILCIYIGIIALTWLIYFLDNRDKKKISERKQRRIDAARQQEIEIAKLEENIDVLLHKINKMKREGL